MVSGRHPFTGGDLEQVRHRIRRQRLAAGDPDASAAPTAATAVAAFAASISVCRIPCLILCLADVERVCQCRTPNSPCGVHGRMASAIAHCSAVHTHRHPAPLVAV